jgi:hypothetical protein
LNETHPELFPPLAIYGAYATDLLAPMVGVLFKPRVGCGSGETARHVAEVEIRLQYPAMITKRK